MYHTIYKVTNLINGKIYIGYHSTDNLQDNYTGSGKHINRAIKKYGKENFKKEVLMLFDNEKDMKFAEKLIVNLDFIKRKDTYNMRLGGDGGSSPGSKRSKETRKLMSEKQKGKRQSIETIQKIKEKRKQQVITKESREKAKQTKLKNGTNNHKEETKKKIGNKNRGKKREPKIVKQNRERNLGKTWEEIMGPEKAKLRREKRKSQTPPNLGKKHPGLNAGTTNPMYGKTPWNKKS